MEPEQQLINIQMTNLELQTLQTHLVNTMGLHNANVALLILQNGLTRGEQSGDVSHEQPH